MIKIVLFMGMFAVALATTPVLATAEEVPIPCTDVEDCGPVPIILPGCPSCETKPAPDITK